MPLPAGSARTFVYSCGEASYIDDVVAMRVENTTGTGNPAGTTPYWHHADDQFTVLALSDANGQVVERYAYDDYSEGCLPMILRPDSSFVPPDPTTGRLGSVLWIGYRWLGTL